MKVGVTGTSTMGVGVAQAFAQVEGYEVKLSHYKNIESAEKGIAGIKKGLEKRVERGKIEQAEADAIVGRLSPALNQDLVDCDLIVDCTREDMDTKKALFQELDGIVKEDTIFASNTSSLSITELGTGLSRPLVGMHFFNPAPVLKLIEVIPGLNTPQELVDKIVTLSEDIGKTPVVVQEEAGFVVNRILVPMINEAITILASGLASAEDIDTSMQLGANHPMGPLALADLIGLDVCLAILEVLYSELGNTKYAPHPYLKKMVRGGKLGRKSGEGFFNYQK